MTNITSQNEMRQIIAEIAQSKASGDEAFAKLGIRVAVWAHEGSIKNPNVPAKNATGAAMIDEVERIFIIYCEERGLAAFDKRSDGSQSSQVSKLRAFGKFGAKHQNPEDWLTNVRTIRNEVYEATPKAAKPAYAGMLSAIGALNKSENYDLNDDEIRNAVTVPARPDKSELKYYEAMQKAHEKAGTDGVVDNSTSEYAIIADTLTIRIDQLREAADIAQWTADGAKYVAKGLVKLGGMANFGIPEHAELIKAGDRE
jgi:hypothetical protein